MKYKKKNFVNKTFLCFLILYMFLTDISRVYGESLNNSLNNFSFDVEKPLITSESGVLIDANTGTIIYEKNMNEKLFPASITKIMTALLILENNKDFSNRVHFSHDAVFSLPSDSSNIAMNEDETLTVDESLYAIMLASANEVSNAAAEFIGGSIDGFVKLMNKKAKEINADNTNFTNPHGLHDENHYTTSYDMALIMKEAIKNQDFVKYISTSNYFIPPTEKQTNERPLWNSNKLIQKGSTFYNENIVGSKTGFTSEAGHTLVSYGKKGDIELISVIMKGEKNSPYLDTINLFDYGFNFFEKQTIFNKDDFKKEIISRSGDFFNGSINAYVKDSIILNVPKNFDKTKILLKDDLKTDYNRDIFKNEKIGLLSIEYDNFALAEMDIFASDTILLPKDEIENDTKTKNKEISVFKNEAVKINNGETNLVVFAGIMLLIIFVFFILTYTITYQINRSKRKKRIKEIDDYVHSIYGYKAKKKYKYKT